MFTKPNGKSFKSTAVKTTGIVLGAKVSDGVAAIMPDSVASYKSWGLAAAGLVLAACVNPSTTSGDFVQSTFLGMAGKQLYNGVTEVLVPAVEEKDSTTTTGKFMNAVIGHNQLPMATPIVSADTVKRLGATIWEPANDQNAWDRPAQPQYKIAVG